MGVITYFIPYLYLFAAMIKLQREPAGPDVIRVPGGSTVAKLVATLGFLTTALTIALSLIPQPDESNKPLALLKIVGGTGALLLVGMWIYLAGKTRAEESTRQK
jgi:glutamate:GABA antiporter